MRGVANCSKNKTMGVADQIRSRSRSGPPPTSRGWPHSRRSSALFDVRGRLKNSELLNFISTKMGKFKMLILGVYSEI
jgi:hypothetical protein